MKARLAAGALALAALITACHRAAAPSLPVLPIGGDFTLTDHNGQPFTLSSLRGRAVLIFFGYTLCPDACPTTLSKLASVYRKLGPDAARVKTLYISVDPERDTPAVLKADLSNFDVDALGLTGAKDELDTVVDSFGAAYEFVPMSNSAAKYSVAHTTSLYALDTRGRTRIEFAYEAPADEIVQGLRQILTLPASDEAERAAPQVARRPAMVTYRVRGKVVATDPTGNHLTIDHEAIPGFMSAMTMTYPVKDGRQLEHLAKGDIVAATLVTGGGRLWLDDVVIRRDSSAKR
ncbi:MAG TPA: SCO family protein [Vicinamibacterales bacterium]|nr:SCO family protein [Vicinamibacterales bacterium]